jgi:hypothetical protein
MSVFLRKIDQMSMTFFGLLVEKEGSDVWQEPPSSRSWFTGH